MEIRDAVETDLTAIVEIYNSTVPSRTVTANTEPVSVEQRFSWFREHDPERRPVRVAEEEGEVIGWLGLGDFYDGRPAYYQTAAGSTSGKTIEARGSERACSKTPSAALPDSA